MDCQHSISIQPLNWTGQVILVEAEPGKSRRDHLQQWLKKAQGNDAATWFLSCERDQGGCLAGLKDLFNELVPEVQAKAPDLIVRHDYELASILPALQRAISVRNPTLTDTAPKDERVRNYPSDRAFRIVHGLIDLLATWHQRNHISAWVIACDHFDRAGFLVSRFFIELMRRRGQYLNLTLLIATEPGAGETVASQFDPKYLGQGLRLNLPPDPKVAVCKQEMARLAQELEQQVGEDPIELELHFPQLNRYWLLSDQPELALVHQIEACSIYTTRGFYEDALVYGETALALLEHHCPDDLQKRLFIYVKLYNCYVGLNRPLPALELIEIGMEKANAPEYLFHYYYMIAMLYARYFPNRDLAKAEAYLERGLEELVRADLPQHTKLFQTAFNRNGLALIRHRQGRPDEAVELCRSWYERLNAQLEPNRHRLHRSVLLYNIAQVYTAIGSYDEANAYFTDAMAMDPNYSEYYNERGNVYLKIGRLNDALNDYLKAIELSPPYPEVWSNLGQCYRLMGQTGEAVDAYSTSLDLDPGQISVLVSRAQAFEMLEQPKAALADYDAAITLDPSQFLLLANRAILHYEAGRLLEALSDLDQAIVLSPENPENADLYQNRAVVLTDIGRFEDAAQDLRTYLGLNPEAENLSEVESQLATLLAGKLIV
jgi:tetratricopeptide (TPR) repeat protein